MEILFVVLKAVSITSDVTFTSVVFAICVEAEISDISKPEQTKQNYLYIMYLLY